MAWDDNKGWSDLLVRTSEVRARTSSGLKLTDDSGTLGLTIEDGGNVSASQIIAADANGLKLADDSGTLGLTIQDGGTASITNDVFIANGKGIFMGNTGNSGIAFADYVRAKMKAGESFQVRSGTTMLLTIADNTNCAFGVPIQRKTTSGITASTTQTQAGGTALTSEINEVATVANANDAVVLPTAVAGQACAIFNNGANTLQIFPASGDAIDSGAVDASTTLAAGSNVKFEAYDATHWKTI